jgi:hypothetical protein
MSKSNGSGVNRREFLIQSGLAAGAVAGGLIGGGCANRPPATTQSAGTGAYRGVHFAYDGKDPAVGSKPAQWAISQLEQALKARNIRVVKSDTAEGMNSPAAGDFHLTVVRSPNSANFGSEAVAFGTQGNGAGLAITGSGEPGLVYALSEVTDIVNLNPDPMEALSQLKPQSERPANTVRSVMRMFCTDVEDKQWFNDRNFWHSYLDMLAAQRFNRFHLALGLGYDAPSGLIDTYFYFPYPFLFSVPGYEVRATNLPNAERDKNLEMIRFISDETAARGMHFQMGLWTHAYKWVNSPRANHVIEGLTDDKHAPYCRDALALLLKECPNISGVTFRIHGESGVPEGSYDLWKTIFEGCTTADRRIEIDMHAKGMDQKMIDTALSVGLPVTISPKYWAEHMGLPYHQAAIRPMELPVPGRRVSGAMALSAGERSFTRYGYGDLLSEDRKFGIIHRMWPGTQRVLVWGDPLFAAAFSRSSSFCGSLGCELMEPTSFKGRKGSGLPGGRDGYADTTLRAPGGDFEKYRYYYRVWGRMLYNPQTDANVFDRWLAHEYGDGATPAVKEAVATSGRILPLFTASHTPSAANNNYWPEMYVNQSIVNGARREPYTETPVPSRFGMVSPLDPQMFARIEDYAQMLLDGKSSGKYNAAEVAQALEDLANTASKNLADAHAKAGEKNTSATFRRMAIDVNVVAGLGRFFAHKIRASALWAIYDRGGHARDALDAAIKEYRAARDAWAQIVQQTRSVYVSDVSYGIGWYQRGHWSDRLPAIEQDLAAMEALTSQVTQQTTAPQILHAATHAPARPAFDAHHEAQPKFVRGQPIQILLRSGSSSIASVQCLHRRTHQAEPWNAAPLEKVAGGWSGSISGPVVESSYPVEYYFELVDSTGRVAMHPGFNQDWSNQPYFVTRPT